MYNPALTLRVAKTLGFRKNWRCPISQSTSNRATLPAVCSVVIVDLHDDQWSRRDGGSGSGTSV